MQSNVLDAIIAMEAWHSKNTADRSWGYLRDGEGFWIFVKEHIGSTEAGLRRPLKHGDDGLQIARKMVGDFDISKVDTARNARPGNI